MRLTLGPALIVPRGQVAADVERTYAQAWELCQHLAETPQLAPVLHGLMSFYVNQGALDRARALAEQQLRIAQRQPDPALCLVAHTSLGVNLYHAGDFVAARTHLEQGLALRGSGGWLRRWPRHTAQGNAITRPSCIGSRESYCSPWRCPIARSCRDIWPGPCHSPLPASEVAGAPGGAEPEPPVAAAGQARRSPRVAGSGLWLVHRGL